MPRAKRQKSYSYPPTTPQARSVSRPKSPIIINVYDLSPPGTFANLLWRFGFPFLHTGIVLHEREYSYGALSPEPANSSPTSSSNPSPSPASPRTGIFSTRPGYEPLGARFRCEILLGFTYLSAEELDLLLVDVGKRFYGHDYNLLSKNCNHFTNHMAKILTQREVPGWVNRAAKFGLAFPCLVPKDWITPPVATDEGYEDDGERYQDDEDEGTRMLSADRRTLRGWFESRGTRVKDTAGRNLPASEQAPPDGLI